MTLVDTSIWVNHFRSGVPELEDILNQKLVGTHPFIIGELACGALRKRGAVIAQLKSLPAAPVARESEVLHLLESHRLWSKGLGWIDMHLLTAALISGWTFWTRMLPSRPSRRSPESRPGFNPANQQTAWAPMFTLASRGSKAGSPISSVTTANFFSHDLPKEVVMATSAASRPVAIKTRPIRGILCLASNVHQRLPR
jgi:predicted nucleic acid-binding protein